MSLPSEPHEVFSWLPPIWIFGLLCLYLVVADLVFAALGFLLGISDEGLAVLVAPIFEESLKLWLTLRFAERGFAAIVAYGVLELLLTKAPYMIHTQDDHELLLMLTGSLIALIFHIATADAYRSAIGKNVLFVVFAKCIVLHIAFNALSVLDLRSGVWSLSAIAVCASVVALGRIAALVSCRTNGI